MQKRWGGGWKGARGCIVRVIGEKYYTGDWQQSGVKKINGKCFLTAAQFTTRDKPPALPLPLLQRAEPSN
jgi:hypothetical protein